MGSNFQYLKKLKAYNRLIGMNIKDSPIFICLGYLVQLYPEGFEIFSQIVLVLGFIVISVLLVYGSKPFFNLCNMSLNVNSKTSIVPVGQGEQKMDYHESLKKYTEEQVAKLMNSQQYKIYQKKKQESEQKIIILSTSITQKQIQEEATLLEQQIILIYEEEEQNKSEQQLI